MADILSRLQPPDGAVKERKRVGRGIGSGMGKTSTRGQKGQKARSKGNINKKHFQGGQTPMQRRLPKRGFRNPLALRVANVNVGSLEVFDAGATVDVEALKAKRLVQGRYDVIKVLGDGELTKKLTVHAHAFSAGALSKIEGKGGKAIAIARVAPADDVASSGGVASSGKKAEKA